MNIYSQSIIVDASCCTSSTNSPIYLVITLIVEGTFEKVYHVVDVSIGWAYVAKRCKRDVECVGDRRRREENFVQKVEILKNLKHVSYAITCTLHNVKIR